MTRFFASSQLCRIKSKNSRKLSINSCFQCKNYIDLFVMTGNYFYQSNKWIPQLIDLPHHIHVDGKT